MLIIKLFLIIFAAAILIGAGGFTVWGLTPSPAMPAALNALQSDTQVQVILDRGYKFTPFATAPITGVIFYPGGHVDYRAYAPMARALAAQGYYVYLAQMPLSLAVLDPDRAGDIIAARPSITNWVLAGHSLGGAMAANYIKNNPGVVKGLALLASYPANTDDLSQFNLNAISIYGSLDGLATDGNIESSRRLLPESTRWVGIAGGNHAQFGWHGEQAAQISRAKQQQQLIEAYSFFLAELEKSP